MEDILKEVPEIESILKELQLLADRSFYRCIDPIYGVYAGAHHFVDLWARDSLFSLFGRIDSSVSQSTIHTFISYQNKEGAFPYRISRSKADLHKYFGKPTLLVNPIGDFNSFQSGAFIYDGSLLTIIAYAKLVQAKPQVYLYNKFKHKIERSIVWLLAKFPGLLSEGFQTEWADAVLKSGEYLYTNVLFLAMLNEYRKLLKVKKLSTKEISEEFEKRRDMFVEKFWNGSYFYDWIDHKKQNYFATYQNLLAVYFDLTTTEQTEAILEIIKERTLTQKGVKSNSPRYPFWRIPIQNFVAGVPDYHNGLFWLQPWLMYIIVLLKTKHVTEASEQIRKLYSAIGKQQFVAEVYEKDWNPVNRVFYKAEQPFAWSSGMLHEMIAEYKKQQ